MKNNKQRKGTEKEISSHTKRELWQEVEKVFNSNPTCCVRTAIELQKKWENLTAKHRAIYSDHKRLLALTGSGPVDSKYTVLTEAVLSVLGKDSVSVAGVGSLQLDTTFSQLQRCQSRPNNFEENELGNQDCIIREITGLPCATSAIKQSGNLQKDAQEEDDSAEIKRLKKRKLQLQVEYLELQLKKLKEE